MPQVNEISWKFMMIMILLCLFIFSCKNLKFLLIFKYNFKFSSYKFSLLI